MNLILRYNDIQVLNNFGAIVTLQRVIVVPELTRPNHKGLWQLWLNINDKDYLCDIDYEGSTNGYIYDFKIENDYIYVCRRWNMNCFTWSKMKLISENGFYWLVNRVKTLKFLVFPYQ